MTMASIDETLQSRPQPLECLLALPAELRNEIYSYLLPWPLPDIIIRARYARLRWICITRSLFNDVAPSLYGNASFTTYLKLDLANVDLGTLAGNFHDHLRLTYGRDASAWVFTDACKLVRHIIVDVAAPDLVSLRRTIYRPDVGFSNSTCINRQEGDSTQVVTTWSLTRNRVPFAPYLSLSQTCANPFAHYF